MTKYYQPLDLTTNGYRKRFLKQKFSEWYSHQVEKKLSNKVELENVEVKLKLLTLKPLQAVWIIEFFNEMTLNIGAEVIKSGLLASGIKDAVGLGLEKLPSVDALEELDPMIADTKML